MLLRGQHFGATMAVTPVTESALKAAVARGATSPDQQIACGDGLLLRVRGATFIGRTRHAGRQVSVYLGAFGRGRGKQSLAEVRDRWYQIKTEAKQTGVNPKDIAKGVVSAEQGSGRTLSILVDKYLEIAPSTIKEITLKDYKNKIENDIVPSLGKDTPLVRLEWNNGGRELLLDLKASIERRGAPDHALRVLMVARQMFDLAIDYGWMSGENPAMKPRFSSRSMKEHQPTISFKELPEFFKRLEETSITPLSRIGVKLTMLTFSRASAMVQMQWEHLDLAAKLWTIPGDTAGLKRGKGQEHIPHLVPLSKPSLALIDQLWAMNSKRPYCFYSSYKSGNLHMSPSSINNALRKMGYCGVCTAHGLRALGTTGGLEVLGFPYAVLEKCLGHITGSKSKVQSAYDRAEFIPQRTEFLELWGETLVENGMLIS